MPLGDPPEKLQGWLGPESQMNFRRAVNGRRFAAIISMETGEITVAAGAQPNLPSLHPAAQRHWEEIEGTGKGWREAAPGDPESRHLTATRPISPKNFPGGEASASRSTLGGRPHLPLVHELDKASPRYGRPSATVHNQMIRHLGRAPGDEDGKELPYLGFSLYKESENEVRIKFRSGTLNKGKTGGEQTIQNKAWKLLIAYGLIRDLGIGIVREDLPPLPGQPLPQPLAQAPAP